MMGLSVLVFAALLACATAWAIALGANGAKLTAKYVANNDLLTVTLVLKTLNFRSLDVWEQTGDKIFAIHAFM